LNLEGNGAKLAGQFMGDDFVTGNPATVKVLKELHLAGFQAACFAIDAIDISNLKKAVLKILSDPGRCSYA